jgi:hypothetical protein
MKTDQYRLVLFEVAAPKEYNGDEIFTFSYLRTRSRVKPRPSKS